MPKTWIFRKKQEALAFTEQTKFPVVSKCSEGACGDNVRLIETKQELKDHIEKAFSERGIQTYFEWINQKGYVYLQEYLPCDKDLRIITVGHRIELAFWRENEKSWKHNIRQNSDLGEGVKKLISGFPKDAHPMATLSSANMAPWIIPLLLQLQHQSLRLCNSLRPLLAVPWVNISVTVAKML